MELTESNTLKGLKICFIAGTLGVGGAERQLFLTIRTLIGMGSHVSLICLNTNEHWEAPIKATGVNYFTLDGKGNKISRLFKIISIIAKIKPTIVQSHHYYTNLYAAIAGWWTRTASIGSSRSDLKFEIKQNGIFGMPSLKWPRFFLFNSMKSFNLSLASGRNNSNTFYLPNSIDVAKFQFSDKSPEPNKEQVVLLAIGRLDQNKRFDKFIELISKLKNSGYNSIKGILIGTGALEGYLKEYTKNAGLTKDNFEFISHTSEPEVFFKKADIFVLTSEFEGTPNVILEAMASGLSVVSSKVGNLPFIIEDGLNGFFFDGKVDTLFKVIDNLVKNPEMRDMIASNARKTIEENFSMKTLETNLLYIYNAIGGQVKKD